MLETPKLLLRQLEKDLTLVAIAQLSDINGVIPGDVLGGDQAAQCLLGSAQEVTYIQLGAPVGMERSAKRIEHLAIKCRPLCRGTI